MYISSWGIICQEVMKTDKGCKKLSQVGLFPRGVYLCEDSIKVVLPRETMKVVRKRAEGEVVQGGLF